MVESTIDPATSSFIYLKNFKPSNENQLQHQYPKCAHNLLKQIIRFLIEVKYDYFTCRYLLWLIIPKFARTVYFYVQYANGILRAIEPGYLGQNKRAFSARWMYDIICARRHYPSGELVHQRKPTFTKKWYIRLAWRSGIQ